MNRCLNSTLAFGEVICTAAFVTLFVMLLGACASDNGGANKSAIEPFGQQPRAAANTTDHGTPAPLVTTPSLVTSPALPPILKIDDAIKFAASNLFRNTSVFGTSENPYPLLIDPLIDGNTGARTRATVAMGTSIATLVKNTFPAYKVQTFNSESLAAKPLLFIGTLTPVDGKGGNTGAREWYRVCLALLDLKTGKIVSKGFARASLEGVNHSPTAFFDDQPAWSTDQTTSGYVRTCQGTVAGDPIKPEYLDRLTSSAIVNDAIAAYENGRFQTALDLYLGLQRGGAADQLRVLNGIYLSYWRLGRTGEAAKSFGNIVDFGLANKRLAVKFLFQPKTASFIADRKVTAAYPLWLYEIRRRTQLGKSCIEVSGHSSLTGTEAQNLKLSALRAEQVRAKLKPSATSSAITNFVAVGKGSSEVISGLGTDDARDALDRRVEFKPIECKVT